MIGGEFYFLFCFEGISKAFCMGNASREGGLWDLYIVANFICWDRKH